MLKYSTGYEKLIPKLQPPKLSTIVGYEHGLAGRSYAQLNWLSASFEDEAFVKRIKK
jgi:hypothetical protein